TLRLGGGNGRLRAIDRRALGIARMADGDGGGANGGYNLGEDGIGVHVASRHRCMEQIRRQASGSEQRALWVVSIFLSVGTVSASAQNAPTDYTSDLLCCA